jgi:hypothetical protein
MTLTTIPITPDLVRGALELERTESGLLPHRLPARARAQCSDPQLAMAEAQPSGVRVALRTAATVVELDVLPTRRVYAGAPPRPDGIYDLVVDGALVQQVSAEGGSTMVVDLMTGAGEVHRGDPATLRFDGLPDGERTVEIWLPHDEQTELVALRADAPVTPAPAAGLTWVHHGSSISHGSVAASPTTTWPAYAARAAGVDLVNLGYAGSALVDQFTARAIRDIPADLISLKLGINVVNHDLMRRRAFGSAVHGFLDTVRDGHPETRIVLVSPIYCPIHEETPGPAAPDMSEMAEGRISFVATGDPAEVANGKLTLAVIRDELARIVADRDDPFLTYLDGRDLYGAADHDELPLPDGLHPDAATHVRIGERFAERVLRPLHGG